MGEYYLIHEGVSKLDGAPGRGSGRYPLGSGARPYQGKPQEGKISKRAAAKKRRELKKAAKNSKRETETSATPKISLTDEEKAAVISRGDLKTAFANRSQFSNAEIDAVVLRYSKEKQLFELANPKKQTAWDKMEKASKNINKGVEYVSAMVKAYNIAAPISNTVFKTHLPKIQFGDEGKKKKSDS